MQLEPANVAPSFHHRQRLVAEDLRRLTEPCVLFEHKGQDDDGADFYIYTVAGVLDGRRLMDGCTVGGEVIVISGVTSKEDADALATVGLEDTINALDAEEAAYQESNAALARLASVGAGARMDAALKPASDKSDAFIRDQTLIRPLIGDDIVLATGSSDDDAQH